MNIQSNTITNTTIDKTSDTKFDSFDEKKANWNRVMKKFRTYMGDNNINSQSYNLNSRLKNISTPTE